LEPHLNGPFTPDLATPISKIEKIKNNWPLKISRFDLVLVPTLLIRDIAHAASIAKQVTDKN
jgi:aconitate hydratase